MAKFGTFSIGANSFRISTDPIPCCLLGAFGFAAAVWGFFEKSLFGQLI